MPPRKVYSLSIHTISCVSSYSSNAIPCHAATPCHTRIRRHPVGLTRLWYRHATSIQPVRPHLPPHLSSTLPPPPALPSSLLRILPSPPLLFNLLSPLLLIRIALPLSRLIARSSRPCLRLRHHFAHIIRRRLPRIADRIRCLLYTSPSPRD